MRFLRRLMRLLFVLFWVKSCWVAITLLLYVYT